MTQEGDRQIAVLFVCMGNICRSPIAECVFRHKVTARGLEEMFIIDSAGTGGWHAGDPPDHRARACGARNGVKIEGFARQIRRDDFDRFDHILCMDEDNLGRVLAMGCSAEKTRLLLSCDRSLGALEVPDPYYGDDEGFQTVYRLVDAACDALLNQLLQGKSR